MEDMVRIGLTLGECVGLQHRQNLAAFLTQRRQGGALMSGLWSVLNQRLGQWSTGIEILSRPGPGRDDTHPGWDRDRDRDRYEIPAGSIMS